MTDEPNATMVARDILAQGGTAADAAVAAYFALAVTLPSSAGLAGGGVCLAHDREKTPVDAIDFWVGGAVPGLAAVPAGAPGNLRGMSALHARFGRMRWEQVVLPAERMARFGVAVTRATARALGDEAARLAQDADARALFLPGGAPPREGARLAQPALADLLARLRARGPGDLYASQLTQVVAGVAADARVSWQTTLRASVGNHTLHLPPMPAAAGAAAHALWTARGQAAAPAAAGAADEAGLVVVDRQGGAVACTFSMNGAFGTGQMIPKSGLFAANPTGVGTDGRATRTPAMVANEHSGDVFLAIAASGGGDAPAALVRVARRLLDGEQSVRQALGAEPGGSTVRLDVVHCARGMKRRPDSCAAESDPRGFGLAAAAGL
ncbi:MAG: gamma-glutamyltransferase [Rhodospirillales bacterium]